MRAVSVRQLLALILGLILTQHALQAQNALVDGSTSQDEVTYTSPWFGTFTPYPQSDWLWHQQHGWLYYAELESGTYLYDPILEAWLFTTPSLYPYIYAFTGDSNWLYFLDNVPGPFATPRIFYSFGSSDYIYLAKRLEGSIAEIASGLSDFSTLVTLLGLADLVSAVDGPGPLTVFAPSDDAFAKLPTETVAFLTSPEGLPRLTEILLYHVVAGEVRSSQLADGFVPTLNGAAIKVDLSSGVLLDSDSNVTTPDVTARNGVIHIIDTVLIPPSLNLVETASEAGTFATLLAAAGAADLAETLSAPGDFTLFAPTDAAFAALGQDTLDYLLEPANQAELAAILRYHLLGTRVYSSDLSEGFVSSLNGGVFEVGLQGEASINGTAISATDIQSNNGVIHVVEGVLLPRETIVGTALNVADLSNLVTALGAAGFVDALNSEGPFTVFAPVNSAFEALPEGALENLLGDLPALADVLELHVISGAKVFSNQVSAGNVSTLGGEPIAFSIDSEGNLLINGSIRVISTDIITSNGVVHLIDGVITEPAAPAGQSLSIGFDTSAFNYTVDGNIAPPLTLQRGVPYSFNRDGFSGHPFTLATVAPGTAWDEAQRYASTPSILNAESFTVTFDASTPDTLFYRCTVHASMGGTITVTD